MIDRPVLLRDLIRERQSELTAAERRLTATLLDDSMVSGLQSITKLAEEAGVSTPTIIRLARKLGFEGFPDLQTAIRDEIGARMKQPLAKLEGWDNADARDHIVSRFAEAVSHNINRTLDRLDLTEFDQVAALLADLSRPVFLIGGRITRSNATYFHNHLQIIRPNVSMLDASPNVWPQSLLEIDDRSTLVLCDIRRYEKLLEKLAGLARERGATIVLFTDQWGSPVERHATHTFRAFVEAPSSWDSTLAINFLIEVLVAAVQTATSNTSADRIAAMEKAIGATRIFRGT